jgi:signal transduction histidine kinase
MKSKNLKKVSIYLAGVVVLAFVYHYAAELGLLMAHLQPNTSPVWPPTGIAIAALLLFGKKYWPGIAIGVMLATVLKDNPIDVSLGLAIGNTLEALAVSYLIKRFLQFHNSLDRIQDVIGFTGFCAISTTISASIGVVTLLVTGNDIWPVLWTVWYTWWIGDFLGALVVAPFLLIWFSNWPYRWKRKKLFEAGAILILLLFVSLYVFVNQPDGRVTHEALIYVIFPFVMYAALRLTQVGAVSAVFLVSGVAIFGTATGSGPLVRNSLNESLILLQTFMGVVSLTALTLAATTTQRRQAEETLRQRIQDLAKLNDSSQTFLGIFDTQTTYDTICKFAVDKFGLDSAWIELTGSKDQPESIMSPYKISITQINEVRTATHRAVEIEKQPKIFSYSDTQSQQEKVNAIFTLNFAGKQIGYLGLISAEPGYFTKDKMIILESYSNLAAVAIQNTWLVDQVKSGNDRLHALSHRLMAVQEEERLHLSRELHDESGQVISAMMVRLGLLERDAGHPELIRQHAAELKRIAAEVLSNLHEMAVRLRPASLDHLGLVTALEQYIADFRNQHNLDVQFETIGLSGNRHRLEVETALFRIVQESLTNVILHARATKVDVLISERKGKLNVMVEDDGVGFALDNVSGQTHLGLFGMRERVEMLGGRLSIESSTGKGTTIVVEVPNGD